MKIKAIDFLKHVMDKAQQYRINIISSKYNKVQDESDKVIYRQQIQDFIREIILKDIPYEE